MRRSADLVRLLTKAERLMSGRLDAILAAEGWTPEAWRVIELLADGSGHFMTELSEQAFLPPASLTRLLDHLVDENIVYRRVDDVDRRRIRAHLTERGHHLRRRISAEAGAALAAVPFDDAEGVRLEVLLAALIAVLEPAAPRVSPTRPGPAAHPSTGAPLVLPDI